MAMLDYISAEVQSRLPTLLAGFGMAGGSLTAFFSWLGSLDLVAGVGAFVALGSFIGAQLHKHADRRSAERDRLSRLNIDIAKMSKEEREVYLALEARSDKP